MTWNNESEERFRALWAEGRSASQIAAIFGTTRSAICAKARRMNLSSRKGEFLIARRPARPEAARKPDGGRYTIMDLSSKTRRWPIGAPGDDGFHFCGNGTFREKVYCEYHAVCSVVPPQFRKATPS